MCAKRPEVIIPLDETSATPLFQQIYDSLRLQILEGTLHENEKLPSIRCVVKELKVSHATVERAYAQLALEGFVETKPRSGYVVSPIDLGYFAEEKALDAPEKKDAPSELGEFYQECRWAEAARYDFAYTSLQPGSFPKCIWRKLFNEVLQDMTPEALEGYDQKKEPSLLHKQLARHLQRSRGVRCQPEQIVFQAGTEVALTAILQLLQTPGEPLRLGHELPGFDVMTAVARRLGAVMLPLPSDGDGDTFLEALDKAQPKVIFMTPSHQFPTGNMLRMSARVALLQWAADHDVYIIEDDSCNEYRYETRAIPSLQSMDHNDRVIYLCNFSKALSPGLRLAYCVLPPALMEKWNQVFTFSWDAVPYIIREVLGRFMEYGYWDCHLRRMVAGNRRRHEALVCAFEQEFGNRVTLYGKDSGMHLYVEVHNDMTQDELLESARSKGVNVYGTRRYYWTGQAPENFVMVGFSAIALEDILPGVQALRRAWFPEE